jgi:hypothetical protein
MIRVRLVLDTNILVSAALKPDSLPRRAFSLAITHPARLYVSDAIWAEYRVVLARRELQIRKGLQRQLLQLLRNRLYPVKVSYQLHPPPVKTHPAAHPYNCVKRSRRSIGYLDRSDSISGVTSSAVGGSCATCASFFWSSRPEAPRLARISGM